MAQLTVIRAEYDEQPSQVWHAMHDADAAINHLIELRNDPATRAGMANEEAELWRLKSAVEWLLTSIRAEREAAHVKLIESVFSARSSRVGARS